MTTVLQSPSLINDFADFLSTSPTREAIVGWRPSSSVEERYLDLVAKRRRGELAAEEAHELEAFLNSEIVLSLLKARLRAGGSLPGT
jgi:hypothetical protein